MIAAYTIFAFFTGFATAMILARGYVMRAREMRDLVVVELERTAWSLGGRLRGRDEPPLYLMPPGQEHEASCDAARMAWMDAASDASAALRAAGMGTTADKFHPVSVRARQWGAQTSKAPSVSDAKKLF